MQRLAVRSVVWMMTKTASAFAILCLLATAATIATADTVRFAGAEVHTPDDGWVARTESGMMVLGPEKGGAVVELYNFSKVPAADKAALEKLIGGRKETRDVTVTDVTAKHAQNGLDGIAFRGTATITGKPVSFRAVALGGVSGGRAIVVIAFVRPDLDKSQQRAVADIVSSVRRAP